MDAYHIGNIKHKNMNLVFIASVYLLNLLETLKNEMTNESHCQNGKSNYIRTLGNT